MAKIDTAVWPTNDGWQHLRMTADLTSAAAEYRDAQQAVTDAKALVRASQQRVRVARAQLTQEVIAAGRAGMRSRDLVDATGLSRERIRQILRAAGVEPD